MTPIVVSVGKVEWKIICFIQRSEANLRCSLVSFGLDKLSLRSFSLLCMCISYCFQVEWSVEKVPRSWVDYVIRFHIIVLFRANFFVNFKKLCDVIPKIFVRNEFYYNLVCRCLFFRIIVRIQNRNFSISYEKMRKENRKNRTFLWVEWWSSTWTQSRIAKLADKLFFN